MRAITAGMARRPISIDSPAILEQTIMLHIALVDVLVVVHGDVDVDVDVDVYDGGCLRTGFARISQ